MTQDAVSSSANPDVYQRVDEVLNRIRPAVQADDGDLELVAVTGGGVVKIRLHGACVSCPSRERTLKVDVERSICGAVPEVVAVEQVK